MALRPLAHTGLSCFSASLLFCMAAGLSGCASSQSGASGHRVVTAASETQRTALLERVKGLAGEWQMKDEKGNLVPASTFTVTSSGSAVREIMFAGMPHEMTNMYTMDGDSLVVTHYCAQGNQPRMRARLNDGHGHGPNQIHFQFDSVSNLRSPTETYMGDMVLEFVSSDKVVQRWKSYKNGVLSNDHDVEIELVRK